MTAAKAQAEPAERPCVSCRHPMMPSRHWRSRYPGRRYHVSRGLCMNCYSAGRRRARAGGRIPRPPDIDEIAIWRALNGSLTAKLKPAELHAAVHLARRRGLSIIRTAQLLHTSPRNVSRLRAQTTGGATG